ncbi:MAG: RluA family pseudouridine synthase [Candidatus Pelagadaptatus aseana]|uniref:RluA family pseudouridine synthase n=1 Tax=Candidatus Pelagadaptatus aseana TaxID=3120508 RepID=UPI0039B2D865
MANLNPIIELSLDIDVGNASTKSSQLLAEHTGLSQGQIKSAMHKGAVWLVRGQRKQRLRRASKTLLAGDCLQLNYNAELLEQTVPEPLLIADEADYSVWFKPFGLACQGSRWGDFASIQRWVEIEFNKSNNPRPVFLVHRLDRATTGLILLAHSKKAARLFSEYFAQGDMDKRYQAIVHGDFSNQPKDLKITEEIDGKHACSIFNGVQCQPQRSLLDVQLKTGRKHQIRRHLAGIGYPIVGDRLYGTGEKDHCDLQLQSVTLAFLCPLNQEQKRYQAPPQFRLQLHPKKDP